MSEDKKNIEIIHKDVQDILENDLSCAICQDIYINPLILNCSHSFCKFCVYRWLSKKTGCPQCRMTVSFQAENLALRNIINKMVQKSSPQFQTNRTNCVNQRLKDEEEQEKEGVTTRVLLKDPLNNDRSRSGRLRVLHSNFARSLFPRPPSSGASAFEGDTITNSSDSLGLDSMFQVAYQGVRGPPSLFLHWSNGDNDEMDDLEDASSDDHDYDHEADDSDDDDEDDDDHDNDVTFEVEPDADSVSSVSVSISDSDDDEDMDDESYADLDVTGNSDSDDDERNDDEYSTTSDDSSSSSSDSDDDDRIPMDEFFRNSLPDTDSDGDTDSSDDSTEVYEDDSMGSRYSDVSTVEYGTSDESDWSVLELAFDHIEDIEDNHEDSLDDQDSLDMIWLID